MTQSDPIGRRGFIGGALGSLAGLLGWRPKAGATSDNLVWASAGHLRGSGLTGDRSFLPSCYPVYTSADLVRDYNPIETMAPIADLGNGWYRHGGVALTEPDDDPFRTFSVTTNDVEEG